MTTKRAFSYIRMSTEAQLKGHSLERQLELTRAYAQEHNLELIEDLQDIGLSAHSGANIKKGKLGIFIKALENGEIERDCALLVESFDRLSRKKPLEAFKQFSELLSYGIEIHTIFDRQIYTETTVANNPGLLFSSIGYMLRAHSESEDKSRRLKKKWASKRNNLDNQILSSICPAWLKANDSKDGFQAIVDRVEVIKKIFDLCIDENMGAFSITKYLNKHFPPFDNSKRKNSVKAPRKATWQKSYVIKILNNTAVYGQFQPHEMINGFRTPTDEYYNNYFPPVITKDRFLLAQAKMKARNSKGGGRKGISFNNIFTKLIECGNCKGIIHFQNKGESPKGGKYLRCSNAIFNNSCDCGPWRYDDFEKSFFGFVTDIEFDNVLKRGNDKSQKDKLLEEQQVNSVKIDGLSKKINNLFEFEDNLPETAKELLTKKLIAFSDDLNKLEERQKAIGIELAEIETRQTKRFKNDLLENIEALRGGLSIEEYASLRRKIHNQISTVVKKIIFYNHSGVFYPWEVAESLSSIVTNKLEKDGYTTEEQLIELFDNPNGKRLFDEMERYFVVYFKNNEERKVLPHAQMSWKISKQRFIDFIENAKMRNAQSSLQQKKKSSNYAKRKAANKQNSTP